MGWIIYEREALHRRMNEARAQRGKAPLPIDETKRMETMAAGHVDYGTKFPLYLMMELVLDVA